MEYLKRKFQVTVLRQCLQVLLGIFSDKDMTNPIVYSVLLKKDLHLL